MTEEPGDPVKKKISTAIVVILALILLAVVVMEWVFEFFKARI